MSDLRIVGLDLSLTSTGIAYTGGGAATVSRLQPRNLKAHERHWWLAREIMDRVTPPEPTLVVVEGPSFGSAATSKYAHEGAGLWWLITGCLWNRKITFAVVTPSQRAKYATGKGNAGKDAVLLAAARRYPDVPIDGNDQADALILAAMGADHLGCPLATVPATHRAALAAVDWPEVTR